MSQQKNGSILAVGHGAVPTGLARVLEALLSRLKDKYEVNQLATMYRGDPHDLDWKLYPASIGGDILGVNRLRPLIASLKPSLVFMCDDMWVLPRYMDRLRGVEGACKFVMYCPIEAGPIPIEIVEHLEGVHRFVVFTAFAKQELEKAVALVRRSKPDFRFPEIDVIPHGVDTDIFYPCGQGPEGLKPSGQRRAARELLFVDDQELIDSFIVLNGNRNQPRKRIDITIKGFALFAADKPENVKLYLHMGTEDMGWDVITLTKRYDIYDRLILSSQSRAIPSFSSDKLNLIYNSCDVGVNTATSEGWGLVSFEHAATNAAQIVPDHSACSELWQGSAEMLAPVMQLTNEKILTEAQIVSPIGLAAALERLYRDPAYLLCKSHQAYKNATRPEYMWANIAQTWNAAFEATLER